MLDPKPRLLIIDDDAYVRRAFARVLRHDFAIDEDGGAARALIRIAVGPPIDAILCDRELGTAMSGQDFFESLSPELQGRTVMCSGHVPEVDDAFAKALGDRYFLKPGDTTALTLLLLRLARVPPTRAVA